MPISVIKAIAATLTLWAASVSADTPLSLATLNMPPLEYQENGVVKGISTDIVNTVFARMGISTDTQLYPFARAIKMVEQQKVDAIFSIVSTPKRQIQLSFSDESLIDDVTSLFVRHDADIEFNGDLSSLTHYRFGALRAAHYGNRWQQALRSGAIEKVEMVSDQRQNILKLAHNRIDIIIGPRLSILHELNILGLQQQIKILPVPVEVVPTYLAFAKDRVPQAIRLQFTEQLRQLKQEELYQQIISSYIKTTPAH
ncbi:substrate-binding periplasmic protein [Shewanella algidipiscicola]|uniref:Solute-binding protein family 3/N-terminal domain-containing protein n=1 Tax=Shewanella algidipiscicola TaxID=614070 RepID=A0ABQ4PER6_9GAMM|nr:transporter substrate-binding domain-containing protein [Shewanella algidipiscicola]GIU45899.1 hypothetical protein TUM4630_15070 [Shewanella algidipiscicola]